MNEYKYRVIVAGGRDFKDQELAFEKLDQILANLPKDQILIIEGGEPKGADRRGREYAIARGLPYQTFEADWDTHGKAAGYIRNSDMGKAATHLVAFWDGVSRGTKNMIEIADKLGLKKRVVSY